MTKPDMTDDWMNPANCVSYTSPPPPNPGDVEYLIERKRRVTCFGSPGSITQWEYWAKYDTAEERDAELRWLQERHPAWHLRVRDAYPYFDRLRAYY